jgi:hypothetical protein
MIFKNYQKFRKIQKIVSFCSCNYNILTLKGKVLLHLKRCARVEIPGEAHVIKILRISAKNGLFQIYYDFEFPEGEHSGHIFKI